MLGGEAVEGELGILILREALGDLRVLRFVGREEGIERRLRIRACCHHPDGAPLFAAPYRSYTNPHIEGHNRIFTEKLWSQPPFSSLVAIDTECACFNAESEEFFCFKFEERLLARALRYHGTGVTINL